MHKITDKLHRHKSSAAATEHTPIANTSATVLQGPVVQTAPVMGNMPILEKQFAATSITQQGNVVQQGAFTQQTTFTQQTVTPITTLTATHTNTLPTVVHTRVRAPIIEETTRIDTVTEIQPIIHREIDAPQVRMIEKHLYETVPSSGPSIITNQAIIEETIRPKIMEEIRPVLHREVPAPFIERVEEHSQERVVREAVTTRQVLEERRTLDVAEATSRGFISAPVAAVAQAPIVHSTTAAPVMQSSTRAAIVEQTMRPEKITEIQPIVHREIDAPQVRIIEKHSYEKVRSTGPSMINREAIIQETVTPRIIEEIQPVLHREVAAPYIERVEQHSNEHVSQAATTTKQVMSEHRTIAGQPQVRAAPSAPVVHTTTAAPTMQSSTRAAIVEQTMRAEKITEIQPIIHREIDAPQVRLVEQHSYERVAHTGPSVITNQAIVEETIRPSIIEEIQPVIHREVGRKVVEHVEQHSTEHVSQAATTTKQVLSEHVTVAPVAHGIVQREVSAPQVHSSTAAPLMEQRTLPTVVEQTMRAEKITEIQPIIHREIDAPQVRVIEKHMFERVPSSGPSIITNQTIVEETVRPKIIEEVQPIVHRNVPAPFVERVEQHTSEHVVAPTTTTRQVITDRSATFISQQQSFSSLSSFSQFSQFGSTSRDVAIYEQRAAEYQRLGKQRKALRYREKANRLRTQQGAWQSTRTPAIYEQQALKWEQRGNWSKAQKNREKVWRLQNPQYINWQNSPAPAFYNNNRFLGYNVPLSQRAL